MGDKTFSEFQTELLFNLGNPSDIDSFVDDWVNAAYRSLTSRNKFYGLKMPKDFKFPELETSSNTVTQTGIPYVIKPTNCITVTTVFDETNKRKLDFEHFKDYIEKTDRSTTASRDKPIKWIPYENKVFVYPTPDGAYTLTTYYRKRPVEMDSDNPTTAIGSEWDEPILMLATIFGLMKMKQYDEAAVWKQEFLMTIQDMLGIYSREEKDLDETLHLDPAYLEGFKYRK